MPEWLQKNFDRLTIVATYDLVFNASLFVREGIGYALALDNLINTSTQSVLCFRPLEPQFFSPIRLIWRKDQEFSKAAKLFLDEFKILNA